MSRSCTLVWGRENRKRGLTGGCWVGRASVRREAERGVCCSARAESLQGVCSSLIFFLTLSLSLCCGVCVSPAYIAAARLVFVRAFSELFCPSFERSFVLCCARLRERERDGGRGCVIGRRAPLGLAGAINSVGSTPGRLVLGHFALSGVADHVKVCVLCAVCFCLLRGGCCKCLVLSCLVLCMTIIFSRRGTTDYVRFLSGCQSCFVVHACFCVYLSLCVHAFVALR
ncbi:unnamed protein product [Ascophyllum nodosum]